MRKERRRATRPPTELAEDIRNYLANRPLRAGRRSPRYRARKFLRRNKRRGGGGGGRCSSLLLAGVVATTWQAVRATPRANVNLQAALGDVREQKQQADESNSACASRRRTSPRRLAEVRRQKGEVDTTNAGLTAVNRFLTEDLLQAADPGVARGQELTIREAASTPAARNVDRRFKDQPLVAASVCHTLALAYNALGEAKRGLPHAQRPSRPAASSWATAGRKRSRH